MRTTVIWKSRRSRTLARWRTCTCVVVLTMVVLALTAPARANTIDSGSHHNLGVKADGTVVVWGVTDYGDGGPTIPPGLNGVVAVATAGSHNLALKADGTVVAWGNNWYGQCNVPAGLIGVVAVSGGCFHSLALKGDGTVVAWGRNWWGEGAVPTDLGPVVAVAAGLFHSLALKGDGTVVAWGNNEYGQCTVPAGLTGVVAVAGGHNFSLALKGDGTVVAWGWSYTMGTVPAGLSGVVAVEAGNDHSLALKADGTVVAWGGETNNVGQCNVPAGLSGVVAVSAGNCISMALKADGKVVAWEDNRFGVCNVPAGVTFMVPNRPPLANAGDNVSIFSKDQVVTTLSGTASDPDSGDSLQYRWVEGETALTTWQPVQNGQAPLNLGSLPVFPLGQHNLTLEVKDGKVTARDTMVLILGNSAPNAAPTGAGTYQVNTQVSLGGQVSDFDGDPLTYKWREGTAELTSGAVAGIPGGEPVNLTPFLVSNLPLGDHVLTLEVGDGVNPPASQSVTVKIVDTTAPTLAPAADKTILWPPDKKMVLVTITGNASDNSGLPVTLTASVS